MQKKYNLITLKENKYQMFSETIQINIQNQNLQDQQQEFQVLEQPKQFSEPNPIEPSISIKLNDMYVVITQREASQIFITDIEWEQFINKQIFENNPMSVIGLNSIINISAYDEKRREMIWNAVTKILKKQQKNQVQFQMGQKINKEIQKNTKKMLKKLKLKNENQESYLKALICQILQRYHAKQPHLGQLKGLQYICYNIYLSSSNKSYERIYQIFQYLMQIQNLKAIFYSGTPLYYQQLHTLCEQLKTQAKDLYKWLDPQVDWQKLFIAYYRTILLNRLTNLQVTAKILDLVLVYGVCIIRMILVRILSEKQQQFINSKKDVIPILGVDLLRYYFQGQLTKQEKFKKNWDQEQIQCPEEKQIKQMNLSPQKKQQIKDKQADQRIIKLFRKLLIGI